MQPDYSQNQTSPTINHDVAVNPAQTKSKKNLSTGEWVLIIFSVIVTIFLFIAGVVVFLYSVSRSETDSSGSAFSSTVDERYDASCLSMSPLSNTAQIPVRFTNTPSSGTCSFIIQYDGLGDAPIAVGEVFTGSYSEKEKIDFIPNGLEAGYELDLVDLGLLRTGKGEPMEVYNSEELIVDGSRAAIYYHYSNRSISGSAYSVAVVAPSDMELDNEPASVLFIWGVDNAANEGLIKQLLTTLSWN